MSSSRYLALYLPTGAATFTLEGASGSYAYTGQTATLKVTLSISGAHGTYSYTGNNATFLLFKIYLLSGSSGTYTYIGSASHLIYLPGGRLSSIFVIEVSPRKRVIEY